MVQTGIPFGEIAAVRDWLRLDAPVAAWPQAHPKRPVQGLACPRSEVSGRRLWGLFAERFPAPDAFFAEHFVANWCPLAFVEAGGRNLTPDKLPAGEFAALATACTAHLRAVIAATGCAVVVGVGRFAAEQAAAAGAPAIASIPHPSPANPAANRGWGPLASKALIDAGIWRD
jgi:single-strand selective monofunctional uracil DNA glycosylase